MLYILDTTARFGHQFSGGVVQFARLRQTEHSLESFQSAGDGIAGKLRFGSATWQVAKLTKIFDLKGIVMNRNNNQFEKLGISRKFCPISIMGYVYVGSLSRAS